MRWMLLVDTCGAGAGIAVADCLSARIVAQRALPGRETQERLMPALAEVLAEAGLAVRDLHVLAVVNGPGSFTGVRIGVAAVKGLAEALGRPVVAISRLAVLAAQRPGAQAWIDAGRGDVFVRSGGVEAMLHGADALAGAGAEIVVMEPLLLQLAPAAQLVLPTGVAAALPLALALCAAGSFVDVASLDANYLRVPDAELARRAAAESRAAEPRPAAELPPAVHPRPAAAC